MRRKSKWNVTPCRAIINLHRQREEARLRHEAAVAAAAAAAAAAADAVAAEAAAVTEAKTVVESEGSAAAENVNKENHSPSNVKEGDPDEGASGSTDGDATNGEGRNGKKDAENDKTRHMEIPKYRHDPEYLMNASYGNEDESDVTGESRGEQKKAGSTATGDGPVCNAHQNASNPTNDEAELERKEPTSKKKILVVSDIWEGDSKIMAESQTASGECLAFLGKIRFCVTWMTFVMIMLFMSSGCFSPAGRWICGRLLPSGMNATLSCFDETGLEVIGDTLEFERCSKLSERYQRFNSTAFDGDELGKAVMKPIKNYLKLEKVLSQAQNQVVREVHRKVQAILGCRHECLCQEAGVFSRNKTNAHCEVFIRYVAEDLKKLTMSRKRMSTN